MINRFKALFNRANDIRQIEGFIPLIKRIISYYIFQYRSFYVFEYNLHEVDESNSFPRLKNFSVNIVSDNKQADELSTSEFDFRLHYQNAREALDKGAIAFCIFVDNELAHIGWAATSEQAKKYVDHLPYKVNFNNKEACIGGHKTLPKYRGRNLMTYGYALKFDYLKQNGFKIVRNAVKVSNVASIKVHKKFKYRICAKARYIKILRWQSWKEKSIS